MASDYQGFNVNYETTAGAITSVGSGVEVKVWSVELGADSADSPLTTDANGDIAAGTLSDVTAGTEVRFRVENYQGMAFSVSQTTT